MSKSKRDQSEECRDRYRRGFDRINWSNTERPEYQGGVRPIAVRPLGEILEVQNPNQVIVINKE